MRIWRYSACHAYTDQLLFFDRYWHDSSVRCSEGKRYKHHTRVQATGEITLAETKMEYSKALTLSRATPIWSLCRLFIWRKHPFPEPSCRSICNSVLLMSIRMFTCFQRDINILLHWGPLLSFHWKDSNVRCILHFSAY